ncbi:hypothetical protein ACWGNM_32940 [Streptomyces sp. NPDC055796]
MSHDDPRAQFLNCTLKTSPERSLHTQGPTGLSARIVQKQGRQFERLRPVGHGIATGARPDMTGHGRRRDALPSFHQRVTAPHSGPPRVRWCIPGGCRLYGMLMTSMGGLDGFDGQ